VSSLEIAGHTIPLGTLTSCQHSTAPCRGCSGAADHHIAIVHRRRHQRHDDGSKPPGCIDNQKRRENPSKERSLTAGIKTKKASRLSVHDMMPAPATDRRSRRMCCVFPILTTLYDIVLVIILLQFCLGARISGFWCHLLWFAILKEGAFWRWLPGLTCCLLFVCEGS